MDARELVSCLLDDSLWSNGDELKRLAGLYWQKRWANDPEGAKSVRQQMGECKPERDVREDDLSTVYAIYKDTERYYFDLGLGKGWRQYDTNQDVSYFGVWVNQAQNMTLTYSEGDVTLVVCKNHLCYDEIIESYDRFYREN